MVLFLTYTDYSEIFARIIQLDAYGEPTLLLAHSGKNNIRVDVSKYSKSLHISGIPRVFAANESEGSGSSSTGSF